MWVARSPVRCLSWKVADELYAHPMAPREPDRRLCLVQPNVAAWSEAIASAAAYSSHDDGATSDLHTAMAKTAMEVHRPE